MHALSVFLAVLYAACAVVAKEIVVTVGGSTTGGAVFQPQRVAGTLGDFITFNFTSGNHTVTQSTFSAPCTSAHDTNVTLNGFNSGIRITGNGTGPSILSVPLIEENYNQTMWYFDLNTCGQGGVGVINSNESSSETLDGFINNAERLNGTGSSSSYSGYSTRTSSTAAPSGSTKPSNSADRTAFLGALGALLPLLAAFVMF